MIVRFRHRFVRELICALALVVTAGLFTAIGTAPARAASSGPVTVQSGSGTVNDPWIPMRNARTTCQSTTLWGNYTNGWHQDPIAVLPYWTWLGCGTLPRTAVPEWCCGTTATSGGSCCAAASYSPE